MMSDVSFLQDRVNELALRMIKAALILEGLDQNRLDFLTYTKIQLALDTLVREDNTKAEESQ